MCSSSSLISAILSLLWLSLIVGSFVVVCAEALPTILPCVYDHCLWIGNWIF